MTYEYNYDIKSLAPAATGGTVTTTATYRIHTFTSSETFVTNKAMNVEYLVVAGGGGGGSNISGGGGGAGGFRVGTGFGVTLQSYSITVGAGGAVDQNGFDSIFSTITSTGGGKGGQYMAGTGSSGGSGGGGAGTDGVTSSSAGGAGNTPTVSPVQGYGGGGAGGVVYGAGGGGGASAVGSNSTSGSGAAGGAGTASSISGPSLVYSGGGGGGVRSYQADTGGAGGVGGGGRGGGTAGAAIAGTANTGGGGGGIGFGAGWDPAAGGSGVVIIRYLLSEDLPPANITATSMTVTPSESPCRTGICTIPVSVTWTNNGGSTGSFVPSITVSSGTVTPVYSSEQLAAGAPVTHTFTVSGMTTGTCSICPSPN